MSVHGNKHVTTLACLWEIKIIMNFKPVFFNFRDIKYNKKHMTKWWTLPIYVHHNVSQDKRVITIPSIRSLNVKCQIHVCIMY